jgi:hypothetical protein
MRAKSWLALIGTVALGAAGLSVLLAAVSAAPAVTSSNDALTVVDGVVLQLDGRPVAEAVVRQQTTANATLSAEDGAFTLAGLNEGVTTTITAWQSGYLVGWAEVVPPQEGFTITLKPHYTTDNPDYEWFSSNDPEGPISCVHCMVAHPEWVGNAHGQAGTNARFFSMYNGTDVTGTKTVAPGYKLDFPGTAGNCATCHAPAAAVRGLRTFAAADMNDLQGVEAEGVSCEFCHKVGAVYLNPATGLPYNNTPGVLSMRLYRPSTSGEEQLFFGPFDDVTRRVTYLPLEKKSQFCAPCHQFSFWGTPVYESYREWLESPYPALGIECQTCHMAPTGLTDYFVFPDKGGLIRDPSLIASHLQPGASDVELLQNTVTMTLSLEETGGQLVVTVTITNTGAGHHVPTDHPGRHLILTVTAEDGQGQPLALRSGPTVPGWGGVQAGLPGKAFAKVLRDVRTGESPVVSYWKQVLIESDNRIAALDSDTSIYTFPMPAQEAVTVKAELRFRRLFQGEMDARGWSEPDFVMEEREAIFPPSP